jgi:two-component system LytT family response regulator
VKPLRAVVVEDEPLALRSLLELLGGIDWVECVGTASSGPEALARIDELRPDLLLLDIELPEMSGIDVLRRVRHRPAVIFTTAYDRYAVTAFELSAVDYLLKPFGRDRLVGALERVRERLGEGDDAAVPERLDGAFEGEAAAPLERFFLRDRGRLVPLHVRDVERLEADDDYVRVHVKGRVLLANLTLGDFERRLDPGRFLRVHRTHIVNLDFVSHLVPEEGSRIAVEMRDGTRIVASRARSKELRELTL